MFEDLDKLAKDLNLLKKESFLTPEDAIYLLECGEKLLEARTTEEQNEASLIFVNKIKKLGGIG